MKFVVYEVSEDYDVILKFSFVNETYMTEFIKNHTAEKNYEPKFLVFELDENKDIDFISEYNGNVLKCRRCVAEYID